MMAPAMLSRKIDRPNTNGEQRNAAPPAVRQPRWYYFWQIALFKLVCENGKSEQDKKQICERYPFARKVNNYLICLCIDARRGANNSPEGHQNKSSEGHCEGPPVKQRHAEQRQAENDKFHASPANARLALLSTNVDDAGLSKRSQAIY